MTFTRLPPTIPVLRIDTDAYSDPKKLQVAMQNFCQQLQETFQQFNNRINQNFSYLQQTRLSCNLGGTFGAGNNPIVWDTNQFDDAGWGTPAHPSRLTVAKPGRYLVIGALFPQFSVTGGFFVAIRKNGTLQVSIGGANYPIAYPQGVEMQVIDVLNLVAGDYIEILLITTASATLLAGRPDINYVVMARLQ